MLHFVRTASLLRLERPTVPFLSKGLEAIGFLLILFAQPDAAARDISKASMEAHEIAAANQIDALDSSEARRSRGTYFLFDSLRSGAL